MRDEKQSENCMWASDRRRRRGRRRGQRRKGQKIFLFLPFFKEICDCPSVHLNRFFGLRGVLKVKKKNLVL